MKNAIPDAIALTLSLLFASSCVWGISLTDATGVKVIVTPRKSSENLDEAARELQTFLGEVTGKGYSIVSEPDIAPGQKAIFLGNTVAAGSVNIDVSSLPTQSWRIKTFNGGIIIAGGGPGDAGTLLGTYRFLDRQLGVKFYAWDCTVVPKKAELAIPELDIAKNPSLEYRHVYDGLWHSHGKRGRKISREKRALVTFLRRNGNSNALKPPTPRFSHSRQIKRNSHNFYLYLPPERYFKEHPEYYAMDTSGVRTSRAGHQVCLSNPDVRKIVQETILANIAKDRQEKPVGYPTVYDFSQEDCSSYMCKCPECVRIIDKYGGFERYGDSSLLFDFLNPIAAEVWKRYPDVYLRTFCYVSTEEANPNIKPAKNIVIQYCNLYSRCDIFRPLTHPHNKEQLRKLSEWAKQTENVQLWDYGNMGNSLAIDTMVDAIIANIRLYRDMKIAGCMMEYEEGQYRPQSLVNLHYYLLSQLMLDADQDAEALIDGFIGAYYGAASEVMKTYLSKVRGAVRNEQKPLIWETGRENRPYQTLEFMEQCRRMLLDAMTLVGNDEASRRRVARELNTVDFCLIKYLQNNRGSSDVLTLDQAIGEYQRNMIAAFDGLLISPAGIEEMRKRLDDEINVFKLRIAPPPQLANVPRDDLRFVVYPGFKPYIDCVRVKDADSSMPEVMRYVSKDPKNHRKPPVFGVYDKVSKVTISRKIEDVPADETYHWYEIGRYSIGPNTILWGHGSWHMGARLYPLYVPADGVEGNPNLYDVWVSVKVTGPAYVDGSQKANAISLDKIVLCRPHKN